jgi:hypothetical protein
VGCGLSACDEGGGEFAMREGEIVFGPRLGRTRDGVVSRATPLTTVILNHGPVVCTRTSSHSADIVDESRGICRL